MLDVLDRVAGLRHPDRFAHDLVEVDQLAVAQQPVHLCLACTVLAHQALDGRLFIAGIVVDMCAGVTLEVGDDPVDELLERDLFFLSAMCPEGFEGLLATFVDIQTEEIFQAALLQRIALHVEKQIAFNRRGHSAKTTPFPHDRQKLEQRAITGAPLELQTRLMAQLAQRLHLQLGDAQVIGTVRQLLQCGHTTSLQFLDLRAADAGDCREVIVLQPLFVTAIAPHTKPAMPAWLRVRHRLSVTVHERRETLQHLLQIIGVVSDPKRLLRTRRITQYDIHELRLYALDCNQHSRVKRNLHKELGLCRLGQLGVDHLIAMIAQRRRPRHLTQEVGMPNKGTFLERSLEDDVRTSLHGLNGQFHPPRETRIALGNVDYVSIFAFESFKKRRFMSEPLALDQAVLLACRRFFHRGNKMLKVQCR